MRVIVTLNYLTSKDVRHKSFTAKPDICCDKMGTNWDKGVFIDSTKAFNCVIRVLDDIILMGSMDGHNEFTPNEYEYNDYCIKYCPFCGEEIVIDFNTTVEYTYGDKKNKPNELLMHPTKGYDDENTV